MIGFLLAGGRSRRMAGADKAVATLGGQRLIDRAITRLESQVDEVRLVASDDRGTALTLVPDSTRFAGPAAGIYGVVAHIQAQALYDTGFVTCPIDAPFFPTDLVDRLSDNADRCAYAVDELGPHPTFAYWRSDALVRIKPNLPPAPSLRMLCEAVGSQSIRWPGGDAFFNINTPVDLADADRRFLAD